MLDLVLVIALAAVWASAPLRGAAASAGGALHSATFWFHAPSIVLLGVDENLERHGALITSAAHVLDLGLFAAVYVAIATRMLTHLRAKESE